MRSHEKWLNGAALVVCLGMILYITVFSRTSDLNRSAQLVPFSSLKVAFGGDSRTGLQIAANIFLFLPLGYLLRKLLRAAFASLLLSVAVELLQYRWILGTASVDDVLANLLGGMLGAGLYAMVSRFPRQRRISDALVVVMLSGGLLGCCLWGLRIEEVYERAFHFQIRQDAVGELTGCCFWYNGAFANKPVQLLLKGEQTLPLPTVYGLECLDATALYADESDNTHTGFRAALPDELTGSYEICLLWGGYKQTPTGVYWVDGEVRHCLAKENAALGVLLADNAYCSVYQSGNSLYWTVKNMASERIFVHIYTNQPERLPQKRQPYGFDNLDFRFDAHEIESVDGRRTACRELPDEYPIAYIETGMFDGDGVIWSERFRPLMAFLEQEAETDRKAEKRGSQGKDDLP